MTVPANILPILNFVLLLLGGYAALLLIALVIWTFRDIRLRSRDILVQLLAALLVLVFNLPGLMLYFILRPRQTLAEGYEQALGQEALLQDIEERHVCPSCRRKAEADFMLCPYCHTPLRKQCSNCRRTLNLDWNICPYCSHPQSQEQPQEQPQQ